MTLESSIDKIPSYVLDAFPDFFVDELLAYEKVCNEDDGSIKCSIMKKNRLVDISSTLKALEVSKQYPQQYIDLLWDIYPAI